LHFDTEEAYNKAAKNIIRTAKEVEEHNKRFDEGKVSWKKQLHDNAWMSEEELRNTFESMMNEDFQQHFSSESSSSFDEDYDFWPKPSYLKVGD
jgi:hypothetical protein